MSPKISLILPNYNDEELLPRALESLPAGNDIQLILLDDGSTDGSWKLIVDWWKEHNGNYHRTSTIHRWDNNHGVAKTMNLGFSLVKGEYIVSLSSDDYYLTDFDQFRPYLNGENDLVYFDLQVNDGSVWHVDEKSKNEYVGAVKFIRREFLGNTRIPNLKWEEDVPFTQALYEKKPKEYYTGIVLKRYNFPREGSLSWQKTQQATQDYENDRKKWEKNAGIK